MIEKKDSCCDNGSDFRLRKERFFFLSGQLDRAHTVTVVVLWAGCNYSFFFSLIQKHPKWVLIKMDQYTAHKGCDHHFLSLLFNHMREFFFLQEKRKKQDHKECLFTCTTKVFFLCVRQCQLKIMRLDGFKSISRT